ncbi:MAG: hypothetical protein ACLFUC_02145 [Bacteroidales bacterium]
MTELLEILKYTLPAIVVFFTAFFILRSLLKNDDTRRKHEMALKNQDIITPIRLQAYERMVLLLERISPDSLVIRLNRKGMKNKELQGEILAVIRAEFEHNLSQQLYLSNQSWELIKSARENLIKIINSAAQNLDPNGPSFELSKVLLEKIMEMEKSPTMVALEFIKKEMQQLF